MTTIIDLPEGVLCDIFSLLQCGRHFARLRLVCKHFNRCMCRLMFETVAVYGSSGESSNDPLEWLTTRNGLKTSSRDCARLIHLLNCLYTRRLPVALRRARHLKIFVSDLFRLGGENVERPTKFAPSLERDVCSAVGQLISTLPTIIRTMVNLEETTLYLSSYEPDRFIKHISKALLALPRLHTLNINFLDSKERRVVPIINAQGLQSIKLWWPLGESDPIPPLGSDQTPIYHAILGLGATGSNLRKLKISARYQQHLGSGRYKLPLLPQLEDLVLENVSISLDKRTILGMNGLHGLRLGGYDGFNCDPYATVWSCLMIARRSLKTVGVDVVGQALVDYLASYAGLEILILKLGKNPNDYCRKDLCERGLGNHTRSLKFLHIELHPRSDFRISWFFEYWPQSFRALSNLRSLKVTTSMNLMSQFDTGVLFVSNSRQLIGAYQTVELSQGAIFGVITGIPALQNLVIHHMHEGNCRTVERGFMDSVTVEAGRAVRRPLPTAPSCLVILSNFTKSLRVVLDREEGLYGSLKIIEVGDTST